MKKRIFLITLSAVILCSQFAIAQINSAGALVLTNSASGNSFDFDKYLKLYLDYFDIGYSVTDISKERLPADFDKAALIIIAHEGVLDGLDSDQLEKIEAYIKSGGGVFSFDMAAKTDEEKRLVPNLLEFKTAEPIVLAEKSPIKFVNKKHYITAYKIDRPDLETVEPAYRAKWPDELKIPNVTSTSTIAKTLVTIADVPLVVISNVGKGRVVQWTTYEWLDASVLGFYNGLDDIVWRSLVWAARKPFVFQGNIPLISMRLDDCYGPFDDFKYIEVINKYGIIPHISFFMDATSPKAAENLGRYTRAGKAETFVHSRGVGEENFFYSDFDIHARTRGKIFPDEKIEQNFDDLNAFLKKYGIKHAKTAVTHWTAPGKNALPYLRKMGIKYASFSTSLPSHSDRNFWPYQLYQQAGHYEKKRTFGSYGTGNFVYHPSMVLDYVEREPSIFCVVAGTPGIKVDWLRPSAAPGYEGTRSVAGVTIDGINSIRHHLDSMGPTYFFTHELNIGMLEDQAAGMDHAFAGVFENIRKFHNVIPCGLDYFKQYNKNVRTIDLETANCDITKKELVVEFLGYSDIETKFHVFTETNGKIIDTLHDVPIYRGPTTVSLKF